MNLIMSSIGTMKNHFEIQKRFWTEFFFVEVPSALKPTFIGNYGFLIFATIIKPIFEVENGKFETSKIRTTLGFLFCFGIFKKRKHLEKSGALGTLRIWEWRYECKVFEIRNRFLILTNTKNWKLVLLDVITICSSWLQWHPDARVKPNLTIFIVFLNCSILTIRPPPLGAP